MDKFSIGTAALLAGLAIGSNNASANHTVTTTKWAVTTVAIDANDPNLASVSAAFPSAWYTQLYRAVASWNNAGSRFRFTLGPSSNDLYFARLEIGRVGVTNVSVSNTTGKITRVTTGLNNYYPFSTSGAANAYDVESTIVHELGHWFALRDVSDTASRYITMYHKALPGETHMRSLASDDIASIRAMYP